MSSLVLNNEELYELLKIANKETVNFLFAKILEQKDTSGEKIDAMTISIPKVVETEKKTLIRTISASQLAEDLGVTIPTIYNWGSQGMPYDLNDKGRKVYDFKECKEWMDAHHPRIIDTSDVRFFKWKSDLKAQAKARRKKNSEVCRIVYQELRDVYGYNIHEICKEYKKYMEYDSEQKVDKLRAIYWWQNESKTDEWRTSLFDNLYQDALDTDN